MKLIKWICTLVGGLPQQRSGKTGAHAIIRKKGNSVNARIIKGAAGDLSERLLILSCSIMQKVAYRLTSVVEKFRDDDTFVNDSIKYHVVIFEKSQSRSNLAQPRIFI